MKASELQALLAASIALHGDTDVALIVTPITGPTIFAEIEPSPIHDEPIELVPFLAPDAATVCIRGFRGVEVRQWNDVGIVIASR